MVVVEGNCVKYGGISGEGRGKVEKTGDDWEESLERVQVRASGC